MTTVRAGVVLTLGAVLGYAIVFGIGFWWPERPVIAVIASIAVSLVVWVLAAVWFTRRTGWHRAVGMAVFALALVFPMVGTASFGPDLALERNAEPVTGVVIDIGVEQTNHEENEESWKTTYTFADEDGDELGTVDYRGDKQAHGLEIGDHTELMADPDGELPLKLAEDVDSAADIGMTAMGAVLFVLGVAVGVFWPLIRPAPATEPQSWPDPHR